MPRRKSQVAAARRRAQAADSAGFLAAMRDEYLEGLRADGLVTGPGGHGSGPGAESPETRANTGLVQVGRVDGVPIPPESGKRDGVDIPPGAEGDDHRFSTHSTLTTRTTWTTWTKPATARLCAGPGAAARAGHPDHLRPVAGSLVARIVAAGGTSRIGGPRPGGGLYRTAEFPRDCPAELAAKLEREGWHVVRVAGDEADDPAEWAGEFEEPLSTEATDYGDEREHDAWLAGVPSAAFKP